MVLVRRYHDSSTIPFSMLTCAQGLRMNFRTSDDLNLNCFWMNSLVGPVNSGISVRLLSPQGVYPHMGFVCSDAAVIIRSDISAVITRFSGIMVPEDYYSEVAFRPFDPAVSQCEASHPRCRRPALRGVDCSRGCCGEAS